MIARVETELPSVDPVSTPSPCKMCELGLEGANRVFVDYALWQATVRIDKAKNRSIEHRVI